MLYLDHKVRGKISIKIGGYGEKAMHVMKHCFCGVVQSRVVVVAGRTQMC